MSFHGRNCSIRHEMLYRRFFKPRTGSGPSHRELHRAIRSISWVLALGIGVLISSLCASGARAGIQFGARAGYSDVNEDIFKGSGDLGDLHLFGGQVIFPVVPLISFELAGEGTSRTVDFRDAEFGDDHFSGRAKWDDLAVYGSVHLRLIPIAAGPFGVYAGAGIGLHNTEVKIEEAAPAEGFAEVGEPAQSTLEENALLHLTVDEFIDSVEGDSSDLDWHVLGGASFGLPMLPIGVFAEGRYRDVAGKYQPQGLAAYGGVNFKLP